MPDLIIKLEGWLKRSYSGEHLDETKLKMLSEKKTPMI